LRKPSLSDAISNNRPNTWNAKFCSKFSEPYSKRKEDIDHYTRRYNEARKHGSNVEHWQLKDLTVRSEVFKIGRNIGKQKKKTLFT